MASSFPCGCVTGSANVTRPPGPGHEANAPSSALPLPVTGRYAGPMGGGAGRSHVRLAELVAALSLGVDLGFGQPMEHVLRQCLIALRIADRAGLSEQDRVAVYYTALLVNVGCHADAHEQAKWFGDDIALKATKYDYEVHSARGALAMVSMVGAGNAPLHRFRVGLEFALYGHRDVDHMIAEHSAIA